MNAPDLGEGRAEMGAGQGQPANGKTAGLSSVGSIDIGMCLWLEPGMETAGS